MNKAEILS
jgi:ATP-dependent metalloprotease